MVCGLGMCCACAAPAAADDGPDVAFSLRDQRIDESSGLAASVRHDGVYWTHNDSGDSGRVFAVNGKGRTVATVRLRGVDPRDAEAIAAGRDSRGRPEVYLADIGDNLGGKWPEVWIYRFTEPRHLTDQTVDVTRFRVQYDDGPRNAETLLLDPSNDRLYIASKERHGGLYQGPKRLDATGVNTFTRVGDVPSTVTDGSVSPDGSRLVLRGYFSASEYRWRSATRSTPARIHRVHTLSVPLQRQGESLTFTRDGTAVLFGSEGVGSQVWRLTLTGDHLPDRARKKASATADHQGGRHSGDDAQRHHGEDESSGTTTTTAAVLAVLVAVLIGAGRKRKKR